MFVGSGERLRDGESRGRLARFKMSKNEVLEMLSKLEHGHREAGNGDIAHDLACVAAKIGRDDSAVTWRQARVNGAAGVHVLDNGRHVASASL